MMAKNCHLGIQCCRTPGGVIGIIAVQMAPPGLGKRDGAMNTCLPYSLHSYPYFKIWDGGAGSERRSHHILSLPQIMVTVPQLNSLQVPTGKTMWEWEIHYHFPLVFCGGLLWRITETIVNICNQLQVHGGPVRESQRLKKMLWNLCES